MQYATVSPCLCHAHIFIEPIRSFVTDGITIGHPCCAVQDCQHPLPSKKGARYCTVLHADLNRKCSVNSCAAFASTDFKTCNDPLHRKLETYKDLQGKASFQLRDRLNRLSVSHAHDALALDQDVPVDADGMNVEGTAADEYDDDDVDVDELPELEDGTCMSHY
jgi:hypothetical protein